MINFTLPPLLGLLDLLRTDCWGCLRAAEDGNGATRVSDPHKRLYQNHFEYAARHCGALLLEKADARFARMSPILLRSFSYAEWGNELNTLLEAIEDDLTFERFYHYQRDKGLMLMRVPSDWAPTIAAFPSSKPEIEDAIDCYALGKDTAAIFHLMRTAEHGLRALARERKVKFPKKPLEWAPWQEMLTLIEKSVKTQWASASAGPAKDAALDFYNGALAHFHGFKDQYRNAVMHVRERYGEHQALRAVYQVREFMNGLSARIGETTTRQIRRWP